MCVSAITETSILRELDYGSTHTTCVSSLVVNVSLRRIYLIGKRINIGECTTVVYHFTSSVEHHHVWNSSDSVLRSNILLFVYIYLLELNISKFAFCRVKHGRECFARSSPIRIKFENFFDLTTNTRTRRHWSDRSSAGCGHSRCC